MHPDTPVLPARVGHSAVRFTTALLLLAFGLAPHTESRAEVAAIASRVFNGYKRTKLPDRTFEKETYAFANGGRYDAAVAGDSIEDVTFDEIVQTLAPALASRGYVFPPNKDPEQTELMIFVFWGTTQGTDGVNSSASSFQHVTQSMNGRPPVPSLIDGGENSSLRPNNGFLGTEDGAVQAAAREQLEGDIIALTAENKYREKLNERNAGILGFQHDLARAYRTNFTTAATDLLDDLEASRYFVVLKAYDFQLAWKEKRKKVLWETRFSVPQHRTDFAAHLAGMAQQASRHFGVHTHGLVRESLPDVQVTFGEARVMEDEAKK
jgi:hypothetical protein